MTGKEFLYDPWFDIPANGQTCEKRVRPMKGELRALERFRPLQLIALTAMFAGLALLCLKLKLFVLGADIGWHLKVGEWIVQHRAFPHHGILSRTAADRPWAAYSWGYEVLLSRAYAWLGLVGIGIFGTALTLIVAFSIFWMTRRLSRRFWPAFMLTVVGCYASFLLKMVPRPVFFSIALYCVVLTLLLEANRTERVQTLYWLPLLFLVWANLHIQFIYGLFVVGLLLWVNVVQRLAVRAGIAPSYVAAPSLPAGRLALVFVGCVVATMIGPYSYHLYGVIFQYSQTRLPYSMVLELQPFSFRSYSNYAQVLLGGAAFFAVFSQRKVDLFKLTLLAVASIVAWRSMRDAWFLCIAAAACIADVIVAEHEVEVPERPVEVAGVFAVVTLVVLLCARFVDFNQHGLEDAMNDLFPVNAVRFLEQNPRPGPLWNIFDWGGFLSWYMPQYPVAIDGRTDLYGDKVVKLFYETEMGDGDYRNDPYLNESGVVLLRSRDGLVPLLENDARFARVYQDKIAAAFVRR
jgi:hypothetical protein